MPTCAEWRHGREVSGGSGSGARGGRHGGGGWTAHLLANLAGERLDLHLSGVDGAARRVPAAALPHRQDLLLVRREDHTRGALDGRGVRRRHAGLVADVNELGVVGDGMVEGEALRREPLDVDGGAALQARHRDRDEDRRLARRRAAFSFADVALQLERASDDGAQRRRRHRAAHAHPAALERPALHRQPGAQREHRARRRRARRELGRRRPRRRHQLRVGVLARCPGGSSERRRRVVGGGGGGGRAVEHAADVRVHERERRVRLREDGFAQRGGDDGLDGLLELANFLHLTGWLLRKY